MTKTRSQSQSLWQRVLFHPMLYASVLLHGLFFAIPGSSEEEIPEELEEQEIEITMLSPIVEAEPELEPMPLEPPQQAATPQPQPAPAPQQQAPPPKPAPEPEQPEAPPAAEPEPAPPAYDPSGDRQAISSSLTNIQGYLAARAAQLPLFLNSSAQSLFLENDTPRSGIEGFAVLNDIKLEGGGGVATTFDPETHIPTQEGMIISRLIGQDYGGGPVYEIKTPEGEPVFYANAVPSKSGGSSTVLFLWTHNPSTPTSNSGG
ncbi:MAG: hypothetical protein WBA10_04075 [Elainellaceae cyanobacterium]